MLHNDWMMFSDTSGGSEKPAANENCRNKSSELHPDVVHMHEVPPQLQCVSSWSHNGSSPGLQGDCNALGTTTLL